MITSWFICWWSRTFCFASFIFMLLTYFLYDLKIVPTKEPLFKLINQGMYLGSNGEKMLKSKGNVINSNENVKDYGADALRIYEMFMGQITSTLPWSEEGLTGARKWLDSIYNYYII